MHHGPDPWQTNRLPCYSNKSLYFSHHPYLLVPVNLNRPSTDEQSKCEEVWDLPRASM